MGEENNTVAPTDYDTLRERLREPVWEHAEAVELIENDQIEEPKP